MNNSEFYNTIRLISSHKGTVALININEFRRLKRINGSYKWIPFKIGNLKVIPIKTNNFEERFRATNEMVKIRLTPTWTFLTNQRQVITPNIETFEFTEHTKYKPHYTLFRNINPNHHFLQSGSLDTFINKPLAKTENAIQWNKKSNSTLLVPADKLLLKHFLENYENELKEFNQLYEESSVIARELRDYQKRLK